MENSPIEKDYSKDSKNLYIFFGGRGKGIAMPRFEFYNAAKILDDNKIFIRDFKQCWYHAGLPGISDDILSTATFIKQEIEQLKPEKVYFVGNSMGGYAAILFSHLTGYGNVICFSPQTFISPTARLRHGDFRWFINILYVYLTSLFKNKAWDLKKLLSKKTSDQTISIYVSNDHRLDSIHANNLKTIHGVKIFGFKGGGHKIVQVLRDEGKLPLIMLDQYTETKE